MDARQLDTLAKALFVGMSRRQALVPGLVGIVLGLSGLRPAAATAAKRRTRRRPLTRNAYGCVNVGKPCRGKDNACCSGICEGEKPKKGKKDKSRCVAHDTSGCPPGQSSCEPGVPDSCTTSVGDAGLCETTTGKAGYCSGELNCRRCRRDWDCQGEFGVLAACVVCATCPDGTACGKPDD